jgi:protein-tyrosine phosphatase
MIRSTLKTALPRGVVQLLRDLRRIERGARVTYLRLAWQRRGGRESPRPIPSTRNAALVTICHGNVLRSAYAEALLKQLAVTARAPGVRVSSAGLHAVAGKSADPRGVEVARENGLDLSAHHATPLTAEIVAAADLLLVMDYVNAAEVVSRHPDAADKVMLLGQFDPAVQGDPTIPDPYNGDIDAVRASYGQVAAAVRGLVATLSSS